MAEMETGVILAQSEISPGIYDLSIQTERIAQEAKAGQFVNVYTDDPSRLLPRPISICEADGERGALRLLYRVSGPNTGTAQIAKKEAGQSIRLMGPLGNGFPLEEADGRRVLLIGGGIGIPPMLQSAKELAGRGAKVVSVLGYRNQDTFLADAFGSYGEVLIATEDGSVGTKGTVLDAIREGKAGAELMFACGPRVMLRAVAAYAEKADIPCWVSMEERMACGIGACLACVCQTKETDAHSHVKNRRVCKDGPVFRAEELVL